MRQRDEDAVLRLQLGNDHIAQSDPHAVVAPQLADAVTQSGGLRGKGSQAQHPVGAVDAAYQAQGRQAMRGIDIAVPLLVETGPPDALRVPTVAQMAFIVQQEVAQVVPVSPLHMDNLAQHTGLHHCVHGQDVPPEEGILQRKETKSRLPHQLGQRRIFAYGQSAFNLKSHVATRAKAIQRMGHMKRPRRGHHHQLRTLFVQHPTIVVRPLAVASDADGHVLRLQARIGHGHHPEKGNLPQQAEQLFAAIAQPDAGGPYRGQGTDCIHIHIYF